ncbi:hypothetical protein FJT64_013853 [Amphibalanus amphitrite]|uniref:Uncharacterized protein n=1 Tax=Amphibalanus amphitrite TaxID=1232801 RepID=A0A6A4V868_AMPAM|nr:hypothetical protein FJT64_013853 [Amphibalanus amphitrite]
MSHWAGLASTHRMALLRVQVRAHQVRYLRHRLRAALRHRRLLPPLPTPDCAGAVADSDRGAAETAEGAAERAGEAGQSGEVRGEDSGPYQGCLGGGRGAAGGGRADGEVPVPVPAAASAAG